MGASVTSSSPTRLTPRQPIGRERHMQPPSWAYEAGGIKETGRVMEPRNGSRWWAIGDPSRRPEGNADGLRLTGRQPFRRRVGESTGPHRGRRAGHGSTGVTRARGRALGLLAQVPERGTGRSKALTGSGSFDLITGPMGTPRTHRRAQGIGTRVTHEATREGPGGSLSGASYRRRGGREAQATPWREGDTGPHAA